ncbi:MAG TPA: Rieske 2Fe-2S domain-containing protein [Chloroflexota bacterium]|nr:Rieske 2Fe-2S domain-containing protein [Chloroflexota bacterium]
MDQLVKTDEGLVEPIIFSDEDIYQRELERIFGKCWLFLGHESMIPNAGDFFTTFMGEDAVIVIRDSGSNIRVLLNKCRHRGNRVCFFDRGNARAFTCTYHGWTYANTGALTGVPEFDHCYLGELDKDAWGLLQAPRVDTRAGLIFASWDPDVMTLDAFLNDMGWYLDHFMSVPFLGGLEVVPGVQKYQMPSNWKLAADNFAGDHYHFPSSHASFLKVFREFSEQGIKARGLRGRSEGPAYEVSPGHPDGVPHAVGQIRPGTEKYEDDLQRAADLGPEAVDWVKYRYARLQEALKDHPVKPYSFTRGHVFPTFSQIGLSSALEGRGLIAWHPKGPNLTEAWEYCAVEKEAPDVVKRNAILDLMHGQSAAGLIAPDDNENFERMTDNLQSPMGKRSPFNYQMSLHRDESYPGREEWDIEGLPGLVGFHTTEVNQRQFYRYWQQLMSA